MLPRTPMPANRGPSPAVFDTVASPMTPPLRPALVLGSTSPMSVDTKLELPVAPLTLPSYLRDKPRGVKRGSEDISVPSSPIRSTSEPRPVIPLKSKRPKDPGHSSEAPVPATPLSRESSPAPETSATPVKRARTSSISGGLSNFHILPSSDDEMEDPKSSPSSRCRSRFNQLLGPSPLQKSFSSPGVPQIKESLPPLERSTTLPTGDSSIRTRARALLSKVEQVEAEHVGTEMNKVFMMVHGRGKGMSSTGGTRSHRRGSGLRPRDQDEGMDLD